MHHSSLFAVSSAILLTILPSFGTVIHSEFINGDLSGNFSTPTLLHLTAGGNTVIARIGNNGNTGATNGYDADYFTVTLDPSETLVSITVDSYAFGPFNPGVSFSAYIAASAFAGQGSQNIHGTAFFNASSGNILDDFAGGPTPLGQGTYSFWFQETSDNIVDYQLTFNVVPEPSSAVALGMLGLFALTMRRRKA